MAAASLERKRTRQHVIAVVIALLLVTSVSRRASAVEPSVAALGGFSFMAPVWTFGVRAGVKLTDGPYVGATFLYEPPKMWNEETTQWAWYTGAEAGAEIGEFPVTRFYGGMGYGRVGDVTHVSSGSFVLWPGASVLFPIGPAFAGLDVRLLIWTGAQLQGGVIPIIPSALLTAGVKF